MKSLLVFFLLVPLFSRTQPVIQKDTSFTIYGTFQKERRNYPFITIADPPFAAGVKVQANVTYKKVGDRNLLLDLYLPAPHQGRRPAVVMLHGGGWKSGDRTQNIPIAKELAAAGYIAVTIEYRLSMEAKYPAGVQDMKTAIQWLRSHAEKWGIDEKKVAIMGFSSGGQMAALAGTTNKKMKYNDSLLRSVRADVQAVIDVDGILAFKHPESAEGATAAFWLGGDFDQVPGIWEEASALHQADRNTAPMLFINSSQPRFHAGRDDLIRKLDSLKIYSEVHSFPYTPHPFWFFNPWFHPTVKFTITFLEKVFQK